MQDPPQVIKEGEEIITELEKKGIKDHLMLNSYPDLKEKVLTFLDDVRKAIVWVQDEIGKYVDRATGDIEKNLKGLEIQETNLVSVQGRLLKFVR